MKFKKPNLKKCNLAHLWWENAKGKKLIPTQSQISKCFMPDPRKYPFAYSRFPTEVTTKCYKRRMKDGGYGGKDLMFAFNSSANGRLVLALCRKIDPNNALPGTLAKAMAIVSTACGRCMNILAYDLGIGWGYDAKTDQARKAGTSCELCR